MESEPHAFCREQAPASVRRAVWVPMEVSGTDGLGVLSDVRSTWRAEWSGERDLMKETESLAGEVASLSLYG